MCRRRSGIAVRGPMLALRGLFCVLGLRLDLRVGVGIPITFSGWPLACGSCWPAPVRAGSLRLLSRSPSIPLAAL